MGFIKVVFSVSLHFTLLLCLISSSLGKKEMENIDSEKNFVDEQNEEIKAISCTCSNFTTLCAEKPDLRICSESILRATRWTKNQIRIYIENEASNHQDSFIKEEDIDDDELTDANENTVGKDTILVLIITIIGCFGLGVISIRRAIKNGYFDRFSVNARRNLPT